MTQSWQMRVARHRTQVNGLAEILGPSAAALSAIVTALTPLEHQWRQCGAPPLSPTVEATVAAVHYGFDCARMGDHICRQMAELWQAGDFVGFALYDRLLFEYWAATAFAAAEIDRASDDGDWEKTRRRLHRLVAGARVTFWRPEAAPTKTYNVLTFVDRLMTRDAEARRTYAFLCESCHPNYLHNYYMLRAGQDGDPSLGAWSEARLEDTLNRIVALAEQAALGIRTAAETIRDRSQTPLNVLNAEMHPAQKPSPQ